LIDIMDVALAEAHAAGLLGEKILGTDFSCQIHTHTGQVHTSAVKRRRCSARLKACVVIHE